MESSCTTTWSIRIGWCGVVIGGSITPRTYVAVEGHKNRLVWCGQWGVYNSTQVCSGRNISFHDVLLATIDRSGTRTAAARRTRSPSTTVFEYMDECTLAELGDGRVRGTLWIA
jgi:hypothetical protein